MRWPQSLPLAVVLDASSTLQLRNSMRKAMSRALSSPFPNTVKLPRAGPLSWTSELLWSCTPRKQYSLSLRMQTTDQQVKDGQPGLIT